jgi:hypothetical protein
MGDQKAGAQCEISGDGEKTFLHSITAELRGIIRFKPRMKGLIIAHIVSMPNSSGRNFPPDEQTFAPHRAAGTTR